MDGYSIVQTKLVAVPTGKFKYSDTIEQTEFPENIENGNPSRYRSNEELAKFFGRFSLKTPREEFLQIRFQILPCSFLASN